MYRRSSQQRGRCGGVLCRGELQYKVLESAATRLAVGGIIVYATCSPDPTETTQVVNRFVKEHPEFARRGDAVLPGNLDARFDGFFAQALEYRK